MKILVDGLPIETGGIGSLIVNFVNCMVNNNDYRDIEFAFLVYDGSEYIKWLEKTGLEYFITPTFGRQPLKYRKYIIELFTKQKYNYVWINNTSKVNYWLPKCAKKIGGAKIIFHSHGIATEEQGIKKFLFGLIEKINFRKYKNIADIKIACSKETADFFYGLKGMFRENVYIMKNGIDVNRFSFNEGIRIKVRDELGLSKNVKALVIVGRLTTVKNQEFAIEILTKLNNCVELFLFGDGPDRTNLLQKAETYGVYDRVHFMGNKTNIEEYLSAMDVFLMPSHHEGMPFSAIEAQANGLKCILNSDLSKDIKITERVNYISLNCVDDWVRMISQEDMYNRHNSKAIVEKNGFDMKNTVDEFIGMLRGN